MLSCIFITTKSGMDCLGVGGFKEGETTHSGSEIWNAHDMEQGWEVLYIERKKKQDKNKTKFLPKKKEAKKWRKKNSGR